MVVKATKEEPSAPAINHPNQAEEANAEERRIMVSAAIMEREATERETAHTRRKGTQGAQPVMSQTEKVRMSHVGAHV